MLCSTAVSLLICYYWCKYLNVIMMLFLGFEQSKEEAIYRNNRLRWKTWSCKINSCWVIFQWNCFCGILSDWTVAIITWLMPSKHFSHAEQYIWIIKSAINSYLWEIPLEWRNSTVIKDLPTSILISCQQIFKCNTVIS